MLTDDTIEEFKGFVVTEVMDNSGLILIVDATINRQNGRESVTYSLPKPNNFIGTFTFNLTGYQDVYCKTREEAIIKAEKMRKKNIKELLLKIENLVNQEFE